MSALPFAYAWRWKGGVTWKLTLTKNPNAHRDLEIKELFDHASEPEWQSVESAPSDTLVLMGWEYRGQWEYKAGVYHDTRGGWRDGMATHWMPLPAGLAVKP